MLNQKKDTVESYLQNRNRLTEENLWWGEGEGAVGWEFEINMYSLSKSPTYEHISF